MAQVLQDMLQLLKESVSSKHGERLEQIVIALIGVEIGRTDPTVAPLPHDLTPLPSARNRYHTGGPNGLVIEYLD